MLLYKFSSKTVRNLKTSPENGLNQLAYDL